MDKARLVHAVVQWHDGTRWVSLGESESWPGVDALLRPLAGKSWNAWRIRLVLTWENGESLVVRQRHVTPEVSYDVGHYLDTLPHLERMFPRGSSALGIPPMMYSSVDTGRILRTCALPRWERSCETLRKINPESYEKVALP